MSRASIWILYARPVNFSTGSLAAAAGYGVRSSQTSQELFMLDVILIAAALGFFALSVAYAVGCDRL